MRRIAVILALVGVAFLYGAREVRAGASLVQPPKTTGPAVSFSLVTVIVDINSTNTTTLPYYYNAQGQTSLRVQKSNIYDGALFWSFYVSGFSDKACTKSGGFTLQSSTEDRFKGYVDWVPPAVRSQLFSRLGNPDKAAITDINDIACSTVNGVTTLSFTGTIQYGP